MSFFSSSLSVPIRMLVLALSICGNQVAVRAEPTDDELFDMSLGELLSLKITSAAKKSEPLSQTAAAVFVITQEDLRRSGATTVPEALRMVPGVEVARINANTWAISARGFNGRLANKLLVMIDGRSVYSPLFSGVYWDVQSPMLEDIERIEVIRGPGATLWGANAVNGVVNIITKSSADTQGGLLAGLAGDEERGSGTLRWGGRLGELGHYRVYGSAYDRDGSRDASGRVDNADDWNGSRAGFRADLIPGEGERLSLQGNLYQGRHGETVFDQSSLLTLARTVDRTTDVQGGDLLANWSGPLSATDDLALKTYYDHAERDWARFGEIRDTFDAELEYRTQRYRRNDLIMGLGYRYTQDRIALSNQVVLDPSDSSLRLFSAFVQDDIQLVADRLTLILGTKIEHNDFTGFEIQPNLRLLWTPSPERTLWASVSRAVRTPGRGERAGFIRQSVLQPRTRSNPESLPIEALIVGREGFDSEDLIAYEAGYKWQVDRGLSMDLALFYNDYGNLRTSSASQLRCYPHGIYPDCLLGGNAASLILPLKLGNAASGFAQGVELAADWRPVPNWRLQGAYSYLESRFGVEPGASTGNLSKNNPYNQLSLRSWFNPRRNIDLDLWLRYTDEIGATFGYFAYAIDPYWDMDIRLAWRPTKRLELALVGQNLLNDVHSEGGSELADLPLASIERSAYFRWRLDF
ncbi:TonB-dependent receptor plug domain-containing protein [Thiorhodococcus fuscus]|uniref:TonB-dependent receptor plug domain-containing protein n=1 Tax=Thiorhodococcus fuscus TaxID=527200 RepID=A0ABW4Y867_9GAMM